MYPPADGESFSRRPPRSLCRRLLSDLSVRDILYYTILICYIDIYIYIVYTSYQHPRHPRRAPLALELQLVSVLGRVFGVQKPGSFDPSVQIWGSRQGGIIIIIIIIIINNNNKNDNNDNNSNNDAYYEYRYISDNMDRGGPG